jgi:single-stranded DNA-binding protein
VLSVLVEGSLIAAPVSRTSGKGSTFVTAQMRCAADGGESILVSVIAFGADVADALVSLGKGDALAVAGRASLSRWEKDGQAHVGLKVTATRVLSVYSAGKRRAQATAGAD